IVEANERWRDVMGVPPEEMIGRHICDYAPPGEAFAHSLPSQRAIGLGLDRTEAVAIQRPDGRKIYMEFWNSVVEIDKKPMVFAIGHDVTEKVLGARTLAQAEVRYRSLVERIPEVIWTFDAAGTLCFLTANAKQVLGHTAEEILAQTPEERAKAVHPD